MGHIPSSSRVRARDRAGRALALLAALVVLGSAAGARARVEPPPLPLPPPAAHAPTPGAEAPPHAPAPDANVPAAPTPDANVHAAPTPDAEAPAAPAPDANVPASPAPAPDANGPAPDANVPAPPAPDAKSPAPPAPAPAAEPAPATGERTVTTSADELVTVRTALEPDPSNVGDLLKLEVTAAYAAGVSVNLPMGLDFAPLHLVSVDESEPESTGAGFRKVFTITLQHFRPGEATVPGFPLTYLDTEGSVQTVKVPPTRFVVDSLLANENEPTRQGEDPPYSLEYPNERAELIIYSSLVALVAGFLLMLLVNRWRRRPRPEVLPPPVPAHETALAALEALEQQPYVEEKRFADFYLELTEIAKGYLEGRFGVEALDRTTEEIRLALMRSGARIEPLKPDDVVRFLSHADLVKFARFSPEQDEARAAIGQVRDMVTSTIPKPGELAGPPVDVQAVAEDADEDDDADTPASSPKKTEKTEKTEKVEKVEKAEKTAEPAEEPSKTPEVNA